MVMTKKVKVFPKPYRWIGDVLPNNKRISVPSELVLNSREIRKCLNNATVYEVVDGVGDVLLDEYNCYTDNSTATPATDVPKVELDHPQDTNTSEEVEDADDTNSGVDSAKVDKSGVEQQSEDPSTATGDVDPGEKAVG